MRIRNSATRYGVVARVLHWTSVALLVTLLVIANIFTDLQAGPEKTELIRQHTSWGLVFLFVMSLRLLWRGVNPDPVISYDIRSWQKTTAVCLHRTIYAVVITQSITGIFNHITHGAGVPFFGLFEFPALMERHDELHRLSIDTHVFISLLVYPLFALHITAAIYHQVFGVLDD